MKKKLFSLALALALCLGLTVPAFAVETKAITVGNITLSDVVITDEYETATEDEFVYDLGEIGFPWDEEDEKNDIFGWSGFCCYLIPDDAEVVTDFAKAGRAQIDFYDLRPAVTPSANFGINSYKAHYLGNCTPGKSVTNRWAVNSEDIARFNFLTTYDLMVCSAGDQEPIYVMYESKLTSLLDTPAFTDLPVWCEKEAAWAAQEKITNGYGASDKFAPNVDCTQAQILTFLWRAEDKPEAVKSPITAAASYQDAINWAYEKKMIDDSFDPDAPCTRSQAVSYIWQALGKPEATKTATFSDVDANAPYAGAVNWAVEKEVTNGYGGKDTFAPDQVCKRGQIVCFLYRVYNN